MNYLDEVRGKLNPYPKEKEVNEMISMLSFARLDSNGKLFDETIELMKKQLNGELTAIEVHDQIMQIIDTKYSK